MTMVQILKGYTPPLVMTKFLILITVRTAEWEPAFLRQAREFLCFPLLPREASSDSEFLFSIEELVQAREAQIRFPAG